MEPEGSTTTGGYHDGSPITSLAPDHLFAILLLLPVDSILSFSVTCSRFRALTSSDALWEAICRREWGSASVEALNSYHLSSHLPWMRVFKQLSRLESVRCHRLSDPDAESSSLPGPRASHSLNFVSDCLVLFGGGCESGRHLDDTWLAYIGNDCHRMLNWRKMNSGTPSGRFGHTCNVVGDFLILFGGINDNGIRQNDTWAGRVERKGIHGFEFSWIPLDVGELAPPPRGAHASCCIDDKKMVIHGGIGLGGIRLFDTWVLELSENLKFGTWYEIVSHPSPPARSGHTLTSIGGMKVVLFGGRGVGYDVLNDIWLLSIFEGHGRWVQILYDLQNVTEGVSLPRVGHSANLILGGRLLIYGGEDTERHRKDDFWALDVSALKTIEVQLTTGNSIGLAAKMWKRLKANGCTPNSRSFHRACTDRSGCCLYILGGMVDGVVQAAESSGLRFDGDLFLVELVI
ncbi:F-box/kelch-repeat protein At1g51550 [Cucurbita moschata]|uniref:F-box/kelch-repeat protein At1g51550 n=1 Tax=Cucurbita moschata TaxID=3662 RepID=A0A6J1GP12_CUCMO|nr:F-box/kelch-repeat protein At1g51550 [Cucurbita moschata]